MSFLISSVSDISPFNAFQGFAIFWFVLYTFGHLFHFHPSPVYEIYFYPSTNSI